MCVWAHSLLVIHTHMHIFLCTHGRVLYFYVYMYLHMGIPFIQNTCMHAYTLVCMCACRHPQTNSLLGACMHTYIHTYIHTAIITNVTVTRATCAIEWAAEKEVDQRGACARKSTEKGGVCQVFVVYTFVCAHAFVHIAATCTLLFCDCVCVCVCVRACARGREKAWEVVFLLLFF